MFNYSFLILRHFYITPLQLKSVDELGSNTGRTSRAKTIIMQILYLPLIYLNFEML